MLTDDGMGAPLSLLLFLFFRLVNVIVVFIAAPHFPLVRSHFAFLKSVYLFNLKKKTIVLINPVCTTFSFFLFLPPSSALSVWLPISPDGGSLQLFVSIRVTFHVLYPPPTSPLVHYLSPAK